MPRGPDAGALLARALAAVAARAGCPIRIESAAAQAWHSATFVGARHTITLAADASPNLDRWLAEIAEADIPLHGHLLADIAVDAIHFAEGRRRIVLAALTLVAS